jgi:cell wall-associated NlpC family hydrolase
MEEELHSSQRRHDEAQAKLAAARLRESAATEPISLKTAVNAVRDGLSKLRLALDAVEANRGELEHLRGKAQTNREDYEQAVRACAAALQDATAPPHHASGAPHIGVFTLLGGIVAKLLQDARRQGGKGEPVAPPATPAPKTAPAPKTTPHTPPPAVGPAQTAAIAWAASDVEKPLYKGECLLFVWKAYEQGAHVDLWSQVKGGPSAYPKDGPYPQDLWGTTFGENFDCPPGSIGQGTPPPGALIFFESPYHSRELSHVALSLGSGKLISTADGNEQGVKALVHEETMAERSADGAIYKGWWLPGS